MESKVLKEIQELTSIYQRIERDDEIEGIGPLLEIADQLRAQIDETLREIHHQSLEPQILPMIREALIEACEASNRAQYRIEEEKDRIGSVLNKFRVGSQVRHAYRPPAIGMGFTEGNFVDSKK